MHCGFGKTGHCQLSCPERISAGLLRASLPHAGLRWVDGSLLAYKLHEELSLPTYLPHAVLVRHHDRPLERHPDGAVVRRPPELAEPFVGPHPERLPPGL